MARLPLEGVRVVDCTVVLAGPIASTKLADLGAEVIMVETIAELRMGGRVQTAKLTRADVAGHPAQRRAFPDGDPGPRPWNRAAQFNAHARNKLSMTLDWRQPAGVEVFARLVKASDVLIENHATDYMERRGFTYDWAKRQRPDIVMVRMPGFGTDGPYAYWRTFGSTAEGQAGRSLLSGYRDSDAGDIPWVFPADAIAGAMGAFAAISALHYRNRTGQGQLIDVALADGVLQVLGPAFLDYTMNGRVAENPGNRHPASAPHGCYRARGEDRWVNITVTTDEEWDGLCAALERPAWTRDPRFADAASRWENQDALDALVEAWTSTLDMHEAMRRLQARGVPAGPVMNAADSYADPHLETRGYFERVAHPEAGTHRYPGMFFKLSATPLGIRRHPPRLGEDNEYVYREVLRYSAAEYAELERHGHIGMDYAPDVP